MSRLRRIYKGEETWDCITNNVDKILNPKLVDDYLINEADVNKPILKDDLFNIEVNDYEEERSLKDDTTGKMDEDINTNKHKIVEKPSATEMLDVNEDDYANFDDLYSNYENEPDDKVKKPKKKLLSEIDIEKPAALQKILGQP